MAEARGVALALAAKERLDGAAFLEGVATASAVVGASRLRRRCGRWQITSTTLRWTSKTASANMVVPVVIAIGRASGLDPLEAALGATFGASLGFMLPVSTPCNAIVYGSGLIPLGKMIRYGIVLDVAGAMIIIVLVSLLGSLVR